MERKSAIRHVLVTGSSGFVGQKLLKRLRERGTSVIEADLAKGIDITQQRFIEEAETTDVVVHLAARMDVPFAFTNPLEIYKPNILGTLNVLEYCRLREVHKIVYTSSYVYGAPAYLPIDENHPTAIKNPYGRSKLVGEMLCMGYYEDFGIVPVILRPFNIYGPGQNESFLIPTIVRQIVLKDRITVKDLEPRRDYIYIDDIVDAYERAIFNYDVNQPSVFNVGYGISYGVWQIIDFCQDIAGTKKPIIIESKRRHNEIPDCIADIRKIKRELQWCPRTTIEEGLRQTMAYYRGNV
jgi:nucleoside-diphosphate-sugar epimerase